MIRTVLRYPDPNLRTQARPVLDFGEGLQSLVDDMIETMYTAAGAGLAATQIGDERMVFIVDVASDSEESNLKVCVNPQIMLSSGKQRIREGCLSFPGVFEAIDRAESVVIESKDRHGEPQSFQANGLLAVAVQHEHDHLFGRLFIDRMTPLKRKLALRNLRKT